jgi:hypothetical protein
MFQIVRTSLEQVWTKDEDNGGAADDACPLPEGSSVSPLVVLVFILLDRVHNGSTSLLSFFRTVGSLCLARTWWWWSRLRNATSIFGQWFGASRCQSRECSGCDHGRRQEGTDGKRHIDLRFLGVSM